MTSEERHQGRYLRRRAARDAARQIALADADNFEKVFDYGNLYDAYRKCRRGVAWKASVQRYITQAPLKVYQTWEQLMEGVYKSARLIKFYIFERGKKRLIQSTKIGERVVQRCLCDNALNPVIERSFIYDNAACRKGKGYDFAVKRLNRSLRRHIQKYGTDGYVLVGDFKKFFESIQHWAVRQILHKNFNDLRVIGISEELIRQFDPETAPELRKGLGLGGQISQVLAPAVANGIDHYIKEALGIEGYGRYMDDFYLIHPDKEYLRRCLDSIRAKCEAIGLHLNSKKTQIIKLKHGFTWLKVRWYITKSGKIIRKIHKSSVTRERKKLKKLRLLMDDGKITAKDAYNCFQSWRAHCKKFHAWWTLRDMELLYAQLFIARRDMSEIYQNYGPGRSCDGGRGARGPGVGLLAGPEPAVCAVH